MNIYFSKKTHCYGFSAVELMLVLPIIIGLILMTNIMLTHMATSKRNNQVADQIKTYKKAATMYLTDNYRNIMLQMLNGQNSLVIPATGNIGYLHYGEVPALALGQVPCLYIMRDTNSQGLGATIKAYLIFGNSASKVKALTHTDALMIAHALGGTAGVMVPDNTGFKVHGLNFNADLRFSYDLDIGKQCGFSDGHGASGIQDNSIIIDLTEDKNFFLQMVNINKNYNPNEIPPQNPSLQKSGDNDAAAMRTNLYLDNVISESSTKKETYCSATEISQDANDFCLNFARDKGYELVPGSCSWDTSVMQDDGRCLSTVKGNYIQRIMGCQNSDFGDAGVACDPIKENRRLVNGTARWSNKRLQDNQCYADAVANYQAQNCDFKCSKFLVGIYFCGNEIDDLCTNKDRGNLPFPKVDQNDYVHGQLQSHGCYMQIACRSYLYGDNMATGFVTPNSFGEGMPLTCKTISTSLSTDSINSLGDISGGSTITKALPRIIQTPAQHRYRSLRLGNGNDGYGVTLKSDAPNGAAVTTSKLNINHAGIQTGIIGLDSHAVSYANTCNPNELGKIVQQNSGVNNYVEAQYRCTFSPIACQSSDYCYLPVKSASNKYIFTNLQQLATCPDDWVVDPNQPEGSVEGKVKCPDLSSVGYSLYIGLHGEMIGCYSSKMENVSFCPSYQTLCTYRDRNGTLIPYPVAALKALLCMAKSNTFVVNDYTQN